MDRRPNFLFILIDDMGWRDLGCFGSSFYETPYLDALARRSLCFDQAYASCPVCSPTRASLLTGKYPARVGVTHYIGGDDRGKVLSAPYTDHLPLSETSLAKALAEGGYATWHVGKWHLGGDPVTPAAHGFNVNRGGCHWGMPQKGYFSPYQMPGNVLPDGPDGEYLTDRLTDEAISLIENHDASTPFFLNLWHYTVHVPIEAPAEEIARFRAKARRLGLDQQEAIVAGEPFPVEHKRHLRVERRLFQSDPAYAAMIANLDANLGRLFAALEAKGELDNTWIVFTSDNGGLATAEGSPTCNAPLAEGKGWMYEGGTRVPFMIAGPGLSRADQWTSCPTTSPDLYPTFLRLAGLDPRPEQHVDGLDLTPVLTGADELDRDALFWHFPHYGNQGGTPGASVRMGPWKLIEFFEDNRVELYNLDDDPSEVVNRAGGQPDRVAHMRARLHAWFTDVAAKMPTPNPDYQPPADVDDPTV